MSEIEVTDELLDRVADDVRQGLTIKQVGRKHFKMGHTKFWEFRKDHPEINSAIDAGKELQYDEGENAFRKNVLGIGPDGKPMKNWNTAAQIFYLCNRGKGRWVQPNSDRKPIDEREIEELSDDALERLRKS